MDQGGGRQRGRFGRIFKPLTASQSVKEMERGGRHHGGAALHGLSDG